MHPKPIDLLNYTSCTLFSTQEYRLDSGNLHITDTSLGRKEKEVIPLDLIDPNPRIRKKNNKQLLWASIASFTIGLLLTALSISFNTQFQQFLGLGFIVISAIFLIVSSKLKTTSYSYYYANTTTHLFTINEHQSAKNDLIKKFIQSLNCRIHKPTIKSPKTVKQKNFSEFSQHLDFLYNFGVLTDEQYKRIQDKIKVKIYGNTQNTKKTADIIPLPLRGRSTNL